MHIDDSVDLVFFFQFPFTAVCSPPAHRGPVITCDDHVGELPHKKGKLLNLQACFFFGCVKGQQNFTCPPKISTVYSSWVLQRIKRDFGTSKLGTVSALGQIPRCGFLGDSRLTCPFDNCCFWVWLFRLIIDNLTIVNL